MTQAKGSMVSLLFTLLEKSLIAMKILMKILRKFDRNFVGKWFAKNKLVKIDFLSDPIEFGIEIFRQTVNPSRLFLTEILKDLCTLDRILKDFSIENFCPNEGSTQLISIVERIFDQV